MVVNVTADLVTSSANSRTPVARGGIRSACGAVASGAAAAVTFLAVANTRNTATVVIAVTVSIIAASLTLWVVSVGNQPWEGAAAAREGQARARLRRAEQQLGEVLRMMEVQQSQITQQDRLALPALWEITHSRIDLYHEIATTQARKSFRNAQIAMATGFVLLLVFALLAIRSSSMTASIVTGALGATAAGLAGYIGRTFVRSQESAAGHLRAYFDQPLEFSRYLAAERLLTAGEVNDES